MSKVSRLLRKVSFIVIQPYISFSPTFIPSFVTNPVLLRVPVFEGYVSRAPSSQGTRLTPLSPLPTLPLIPHGLTIQETPVPFLELRKVLDIFDEVTYFLVLILTLNFGSARPSPFRTPSHFTSFRDFPGTSRPPTSASTPFN